jgi:hypothetical protein
VRNVIGRINGVGYKLYMDNFFSSPSVFYDLQTTCINCCGNVRQNCKGMQRDLENKTLKLNGR